AHLAMHKGDGVNPLFFAQLAQIASQLETGPKVVAGVGSIVRVEVTDQAKDATLLTSPTLSLKPLQGAEDTRAQSVRRFGSDEGRNLNDEACVTRFLGVGG